jgi:hypothetical protein
VPEQRLLSPEIGLRWRRRHATLLRETLILLGFSLRSLYIGKGAMSEGSQGPHTWWWRGQEGTRATMGVPASWPPSGSPSDFVSCQEKYEV